MVVYLITDFSMAYQDDATAVYGAADMAEAEFYESVDYYKSKYSITEDEMKEALEDGENFKCFTYRDIRLVFECKHVLM